MLSVPNWKDGISAVEVDKIFVAHQRELSQGTVTDL